MSDTHGSIRVVRFTWAQFCGLALLLSGIGLFAALLDKSALAIPLAIVFGLSMVSLSILEIGGRRRN